MDMIKTFKCKNTEKLFDDDDVKKFRSISRAARLKLEILNAAVSLNSLRVPPGNRFEQLKGDRKGQHSIRINTYEKKPKPVKGINGLYSLKRLTN